MYFGTGRQEAAYLYLWEYFIIDTQPLSSPPGAACLVWLRVVAEWLSRFRVVARAPGRLQSQLTGQRRLCDQLLDQKDQLVRRLEAELRCMDDEYNLELTTHGQVRYPVRTLLLRLQLVVDTEQGSVVSPEPGGINARDLCCSLAMLMLSN